MAVEKILEVALYDELAVFKASYDLLLDIYRFSSTLTLEFKFTIGEKLKNETLDLLILVFRANSEREKTQAIQKAREQIEMVRLSPGICSLFLAHVQICKVIVKESSSSNNQPRQPTYAIAVRVL